MAALQEETYRRLLGLQEIDLRLDALAARRNALPAELRSIEAAAKAKHDEVAAQKKAAEEAVKERKTIELDVKAKQGQVSKLLEQQWSLKTNEAFAALQEEVKNLKAEIEKLEEKILELSYREDELAKQNKALAAEAAQATAAVGTRKTAADQELAKIAKDEEGLREERAKAAGLVEAPLLSRYEQIRKGKGTAIAAVKDENCQGCHMSIPPQALVKIRQGELVACQNCARILYV